MHAHKLLIAVVTLGLFATAGAAVAGDRAGEILADHSLTALDGSQAKLSSFKGDVVVVNFWASWCAPCRKELPVMNRWHDDWRDRGARVVAISVDSEARKAKKFADKIHLSLPLFHDGPAGLAKQLDLPSLPCTYVLDRHGNVVTVITSSSADDLSAVHNKVESLLKNDRPKVQKAASSTTKDGGTP